MNCEYSKDTDPQRRELAERAHISLKNSLIIFRAKQNQTILPTKVIVYYAIVNPNIDSRLVLAEPRQNSIRRSNQLRGAVLIPQRVAEAQICGFTFVKAVPIIPITHRSPTRGLDMILRLPAASCVRFQCPYLARDAHWRSHATNPPRAGRVRPICSVCVTLPSLRS